MGNLVFMSWYLHDSENHEFIRSEPFNSRFEPEPDESRLSNQIVHVIDSKISEKSEINNNIIDLLGFAPDPRVLVIYIDVNEIINKNISSWGDDLREVVGRVASCEDDSSSRPLPWEFLSRTNRVAIAYLVPLSRLPKTVKEYTDGGWKTDNEHMIEKVENDLRSAIDANFPPLPPLDLDSLLQRLFADLPTDLDGRAAALSDIHRKFRQEFVTKYQPLLNARIQAMPHDTYEQKKDLAKWVNEELRRFGLAIRCKVEMQEAEGVVERVYPAILVADASNNTAETGRFRLEYQGWGKPKRKLLTIGAPMLELMVAPSKNDPVRMTGESEVRVELVVRQGGARE
jgi:hypothetical protein